MSAQEATIAATRRKGLRAIAETYFDALRRKDFSLIPYDDHVTLRTPLVPGGVHQLLSGKEALRTQWWQPLEPALEGLQVTIFDYFINDSMTAIVAEAEIKISSVNPPVKLRVADRFTVNEEGKIIEQENHFDPRDITNPGWNN